MARVFNFWLFLSFILLVNAQVYRFLGSFPVYSVAFTNINRFNNTSPYQFIATGFGVFEGDAVFAITDVKSVLGNINQTQPQQVTNDITWPNEADLVPQGAIQGTPLAVWVAGGFLVPGSTTGALNIIPTDGTNFNDPVQISQDKSGWFYHTMKWFDVNNDGLLDVVSARATKPIFIGHAAGELVWYEQPQGGLSNTPWNINHITAGPDIFFDFYDINNDGVPEIIAPQFFSAELVLYYSTNGNWGDASSVQSVVIDPKLGPGFDIEFVDVNNDGKIDLVVTNNEAVPAKASVFAYEIPTNWKVGNWTRHTLASGFVVHSSNANAGCPGTVTPVYPKTGMGGRPWLLLAGDDSQLAYQLRPTQQTGWAYETTTIVSPSATVGQISAADINGDGYTEFFVPAYDTGIVYAYTYAPQ